MTLRRRLIQYFVLSSLIPLLLIAYVSYVFSGRILREKSTEFIAGTVTQVGRELTGLLQDSVELANMASSEPIVQEALRRPFEYDIARRYAQELRIDSRLNFIQSYMVSDIFGIYVIGTNGGLFKSNYTTFRMEDYSSQSWFRQILESANPVWITTESGALAVDTLPDPYITVGIPIVDKATGTVSGITLVDFRLDVIEDLISSAVVGQGAATLWDGDLREISTWPKEHEPVEANRIVSGDGVHWTESRDQRNLYASINFESGWRLVTVVPADEILRESRLSGLAIIVALAAIGAVSVAAGLRFSKSISDPITHVTRTMRVAEQGNLDVGVELSRNDEIGALANGFNMMIQRVRELLQRIADEQQELAFAEVRNLQAQINPHFLYNALDSIVWLSLEGRNEEVVTTTRALTRLFRRSLSGGRDIIPFGDELEHVRSYLTIQKIRYADRVDFSIQCSEDLKQIPILKLTLQPLVENALYHGIKQSRRPGTIDIRATRDERDLIVEVEDNGVGMTPEQVEDVRKEIERPNTPGTADEHVGLRNVQRRISIVAGSEYGFEIESRVGHGTIVRLRFPISVNTEQLYERSHR